MARQIDCPSCGAAVKYRGGAESAQCKYCGNSVIIPPELRGRARVAHTGQPGTSGCGKTASVMAALGVVITMGVGAMIFFISQKADSDGMQDAFTKLAGGTSVDMEFGGPGSGLGHFTDPECIAVDGSGNIYVGEWESGRVQIFDETGEFVEVWYYADPEEYYLMAMASDRDGILYLVYDSEIHIHDGLTGEHLGNLYHPDGWGFEDVDTAPNGEIVASWYCNRDDLVVFSGDKAPEVIREAVSGITGDSELDIIVAAGNTGEKYLLGSFNSVIVTYDRNGRYADRFGSDDVFSMPFAMDVDPMGNIWVSDFGDLHKFSPSGELMNTLVTANGLNDFVIDDGFRLWGITNDDTIVMMDLSDQ